MNKQNKYKMCQGDCLEKLKKLPDNYIDLLLTDPPYGITQNKWDTVVPFDKMWEQVNRVVKKNGAMIFTAAQPFAANLIMSNVGNFKYEVIWQKTIGSGQLNIKHQPLRTHENVLIFYRDLPTYNEQKLKGEPYKINRKTNYENENYGKQKNHSKINDGFRHAKSVILISNPRIKRGHATQKPVELMEYFIKTFSNENDIILDPFMGSGTTGVACMNLNRKFIGIEINEEYFYTSKERIKECLKIKK